MDEVQRAPALLSYLQGLLDDRSTPRQFILTGSSNPLLTEKIAQTLAGRTRIFTLVPLAQREFVHNALAEKSTLDERLFCGGYPKIFDRQLDPQTWLAQYYLTYVERDVRSLAGIANLDLFDRFIRLLAGRVGQLLNLSSLGNDCGVSQPTAAAWLSVLSAGFVCFKLQPHFNNYAKRIIKSPKVYF